MAEQVKLVLIKSCYLHKIIPSLEKPETYGIFLTTCGQFTTHNGLCLKQNIFAVIDSIESKLEAHSKFKKPHPCPFHYVFLAYILLQYVLQIHRSFLPILIYFA